MYLTDKHKLLDNNEYFNCRSQSTFSSGKWLFCSSETWGLRNTKNWQMRKTRDCIFWEVRGPVLEPLALLLGVNRSSHGLHLLLADYLPPVVVLHEFMKGRKYPCSQCSMYLDFFFFKKKQKKTNKLSFYVWLYIRNCILMKWLKMDVSKRGEQTELTQDSWDTI